MNCLKILKKKNYFKRILLKKKVRKSMNYNKTSKKSYVLFNKD